MPRFTMGFWKPHTSDYIAAVAVFFPSILKPHASDYVAAGVLFFSQNNGPLNFGVTHKWIWIWIYPVCDPMGYPINKRGGSCPVGHGATSI